MFRFIALGWNASIAQQTAKAMQLAGAIRSLDVWQPALARPGLEVFTTGSRPGVNSAYPLPAGQGVVLGRLFRRDDFGSPAPRHLELSVNEAERIVRTGGQELIDRFWGRYVAFIPGLSGQPSVLRDPSGTLPCYLVEVDGVSVVFAWMEDICKLLVDRPATPVNWDAVAAHLLFGRLSGRDTALDGVFQVLPGELTPMCQGSGAPATLWNAVDVARRHLEEDPSSASERLRATVIACAQAWGSCYDSILLRLSGGLDSAILLSSLSLGVDSPRVTCLNYHSVGSDSDERGYARLAAERAGVMLLERERDIHFRLDEVLSVARTPVPGSYVGRMGTGRTDAETASAHGAAALFTGCGGDQLFFELPCTWPASDHLRLRGLAGFIGAALDAARLGRVSLWRAAWRAFVDHLRPPHPLDGAGRYLVLASPERLAAIQNAERFVHPAVRGSTGLPVGKLHQVYELAGTLEYYDPYLGQAAPELVNPLLSQPLIELCLALPTYLLTHGGRGRGLARMAFADHVPPAIQERRSKGGMEEHITAVLQRNLPLVRELLLDGLLVRHGLLDRTRLETSLSGRPSTMDAHVGEIHNCIAIEVWSRRCSESICRRAL